MYYKKKLIIHFPPYIYQECFTKTVRSTYTAINLVNEAVTFFILSCWWQTAMTVTPSGECESYFVGFCFSTFESPVSIHFIKLASNQSSALFIFKALDLHFLLFPYFNRGHQLTFRTPPCGVSSATHWRFLCCPLMFCLIFFGLQWREFKQFFERLCQIERSWSAYIYSSVEKETNSM